MSRSRGERLFWERFTSGCPIKATAVVLVAALGVVGCGREGAMSRSLDRIDYDSLPGDAKRPKTAAEKLHDDITKLNGLLTRQAKGDLSSEQVGAARAASGRITAELTTLHRQFKADRTKLEDLHAKAALARLDAIERRSVPLERSLRSALAALPQDGVRATGPAQRAAQALSALAPEQEQQPLSSDLSFGAQNAQPQAPTLSAGIAPAYSGGPTATETPSNLPATAEPADLEPTPETRVTPAIAQLAGQLGHDPVKIYAYVRNEIRYEPYYGIRKGADQTLAERSGSDADQAALLLALLRTSGIHARFVQGVVELPAAQAADWLGVDVQHGERLDAATEILANGGVPTTQVRANGALTKVRFTHVWAEAYVSDDAYRGAEEGLGSKTWLPLDPSIKRTKFVAPRVDVQEQLKPAVTDWAEEMVDRFERYGDDALVAPSQALMSSRVEALVAEQKAVVHDAGVGDHDGIAALIGSRDPLAVDAAYLPASTAFKTVAVTDERRSLPDGVTASVTFKVSGSDPLSVPDPESGDDGGFSYTAPTRDLANKRITITYVPATEDDAAIIDAYHGLLNAPSYAAALIPVLRVDGRIVARGHQAASTGYAQNFRIVYREPGFAAEAVENPIAVGGISAVSLDLGSKSIQQITDRSTALAALGADTTTANVLTDARAGEMLAIMGDLYFARNDQQNVVTASTAQVRQVRGLSGAIVAASLHTRTLAGFPIATSLGGASFDVDQDVQSVTNLTADADTVTEYIRASGMNTSLTEGQILEHAFRSPAASTTKILGVAAGQQIPIFQIDRGNAERAIPQLSLSDATKNDIRTAAAQGATVVVPQTSVAIGGWTGVGYVVSRGLSTDYRISGGASGGGWELPNIPIPGIPTDKGSLGVWVAVTLGFPKQEAACISTVLDVLGLWEAGTGFVVTAGGVMAPFLVGFVPGSFVIFAFLLGYLVATAALLLAAASEWNDANACINREGL